MANSPTSNQTTKGGALDIKDEQVIPVGSEADLRASQGSVGKQSQPAQAADAVQPVEKFDPPVQDGEHRIFQNGDTDRDQ